jgi:cysteinyl-tRNA synthetase
VKLIPNFAELLHEIKLPAAEKCFLVEDGDEKFIKKWIHNGQITCELEKLFEWINVEYKLKRTNLNKEESRLADEVKKRFPTDQWRVIKIFSEHQRKYRYYKKAIEDVKRRTTPRMNEQAIMTIFSPGWGINT